MARTRFSGPVVSDNGFVTQAATVATLPATGTIGQMIYVSDGLAGAPTIAVWNGTNWISAAGTPVATS